MHVIINIQANIKTLPTVFNIAQRFPPRNSNLLAFIGYSGSCCISVTFFLELHLQYFIAGLVFTQLNHFHLQGDALVVSVKLHNRQLV